MEMSRVEIPAFMAAFISFSGMPEKVMKAAMKAGIPTHDISKDTMMLMIMMTMMLTREHLGSS